jgi:hypothetical protein
MKLLLAALLLGGHANALAQAPACPAKPINIVEFDALVRESCAATPCWSRRRE